MSFIRTFGTAYNYALSVNHAIERNPWFCFIFFQLFETCLHFLGESTPRPSASLPLQDGHGHYEILLPLRVGAIRILLW